MPNKTGLVWTDPCGHSLLLSVAMSNSTTIDLPNSLNLSPHLSAQKYFYVCTLTVLAWDTLVLTPRSYRLGRSKSWPALKALYYFLQIWVLSDFVVTGSSSLPALMRSSRPFQAPCSSQRH